MPNPFDSHHSAAALKFASDDGNAALVIGKSRKYARAPLAVALQLIYSALAVRQCRLYFDAEGKPEGMIIWAWLSAYTMRSPSPQGAFTLPLGEWNEGDRLCIVDVLAVPEHVARIVNDFLNHTVPLEMTIYTYPTLRTPQAVHFTRWKRAERKALIASLEGTC